MKKFTLLFFTCFILLFGISQYEIICQNSAISNITDSNNSKYGSSLAYVAMSQEIYSFELYDFQNATSTGYVAPVPLSSMCCNDDNEVYFVSEMGSFGLFDTETGDFTTLKYGMNSRYIGYNPVEDIVYGCKPDLNTSIIYTVELSTGNETQLHTFNRGLYGIEFTNDGRCFVVDMEVGGISELKLETFQFITLVSDYYSYFNWGIGQELDYDITTNMLYWLTFDVMENVAKLFEINPENGEIQLIGQNTSMTNGLVIIAECNPIQNATVMEVNNNTVRMLWVPPTDASDVISYLLYRQDEDDPFAIVDAPTTLFIDQEPGEHPYCYEIRVHYSSGCISNSDTYCCSEEIIVLGDVNDDGEVNVSDIQVEISYILDHNPQPFNINNADVNFDNIINVLDIVGIVNILIGK